MQGKRLSSLPVSQTVCDFTSYARDEGLCVRGGGVGGGGGGGGTVGLDVWIFHECEYVHPTRR